MTDATVLAALDSLARLAATIAEEALALKARLIADPTVDTSATDAAVAEHAANRSEPAP